MQQIQPDALTALRESEEKFRATFEQAAVGMSHISLDGTFLNVNQKLCDILGYEREELLGRKFQEITHPEDLSSNLDALGKMARGDVQTYVIEKRYVRKDGSIIWVKITASSVRDSSGAPKYSVGVVEDITESRRANESLQFMVEASHLLTSSLDYHVIMKNIAQLAVPRVADFCLVDMANEDGSIERMMVAHEDPAKAEAWREMQRRFPLNPHAQYTIPQAIRTGKSVVYEEITPEKIDAMSNDPEQAATLQKFGLKSSMIVPLVARGRAIGAITLISAESGRRYTAQDVQLAEVLARRAALAIDNAVLFAEMQKARHVAEEASRAKDEFLATLSHELRTPLTPIIGWVHMLRGGMLTTDYDRNHALGVIDRNSQALTRLINDLLDMSAILSGKMHFDLAPVPVDAALREAIETIRPQAEQRNIQIDVYYSDWDSALAVLGDHTRLVQIFWNLLSNAVKFSDEGASVRVFCETDAREVRIAVEDEGQGIGAEFMLHIFDRFRQADSSKTRAHGGLGLGLALVKSFVEAHGGTCEAASEGLGRGSRFTVRLPRFAKKLEVRPTDSVETKPSDDGHEGARILVVDDAEDTLSMLGVVLRSRGYRPTLCESAEEALDALNLSDFDLIVSDIGMPHMDGYELMRRVRLMPNVSELPAIALTGYATQRDADQALAAGYDEHLPKPVDPAELMKLITQMLDKKSGV